ncbi:unnamed protein product [Chrysoparadoxa australica]
MKKEAQQPLLQTPAPPSIKRDPAAWMKDLSPTKTLLELFIPATHNSGTQRFEQSSCLCLTGAARLWARCQRLSIYEQLNAGVRFLDLRVAQEGDGPCWISHSFNACLLEDALADIARFVRERPSEVVVVAAVKDYIRSVDNVTELLTHVQSALGDTLIGHRSTWLGHIPLEQLRAAGNVVMLWGLDIPADHPLSHCLYHRQSYLQEYWPNVCKVKDLRSCLECNLESVQRSHGSRMQWFKCELTFNAKSIVLNSACGRYSIARTARRTNTAVLEWLQTTAGPGVLPPSVMSTDFVEEAFLAEVIERNFGGEVVTVTGTIKPDYA